MSEKKLDLIAQLLAKAESTTPEEAEALTEHAARLMQKYAIDQAQIDERRRLHGKTSEPIIEALVTFTGTYALDLLEIGTLAVRGLGGMRPLRSFIRNGQVLWIVGHESDVRQAEILVRSLQVQAMVAMRDWWSGERASWAHFPESGKRKARSNFLRGFGVGVYQRLVAARRKLVEKASTGAELVLVSRQQRVDAHVDAMSTRKDRGRKAPGYGAHAGQLAGANANTGGSAATNRKALAS